MLAFAQGDYARTVELILPVRYKVIRIGGSHAQRDIVTQTLIAAAERSGQTALARALLAERLAVRPTARTKRDFARVGGVTATHSFGRRRFYDDLFRPRGFDADRFGVAADLDRQRTAAGLEADALVDAGAVLGADIVGRLDEIAVLDDVNPAAAGNRYLISRRRLRAELDDGRVSRIGFARSPGRIGGKSHRSAAKD